MATNPGTTNLLAWWQMDEAAGNRADSHTGGYTLTDVNGVGTAEGGADFDDADDDYLESANAAFSWADEAVTWTGWVWLDDWNGDSTIMGRWGAAGDRQYQLRADDSTNDFQIHVSNDGTASTAETNATKGDVSGEWIFWAWWHDPTANELGLRINAVTEDMAYATGLSDETTADLRFARRTDVANELDGKEKVTNVWNAVLSSAELDWIYNSGSSRSYSELTEAFPGRIIIL